MTILTINMIVFLYVIFQYKGTRSSSSKVGDIKLATINDIHEPCGSWKDHYEARQKVYNTQLIAGVSLLVGTIIFVSIK